MPVADLRHQQIVIPEVIEDRIAFPWRYRHRSLSWWWDGWRYPSKECRYRHVSSQGSGTGPIPDL